MTRAESLEEQLSRLSPEDRAAVMSHIQAGRAVVQAAKEVDAQEEFPPSVIGDTERGVTELVPGRKIPSWLKPRE